MGILLAAGLFLLPLTTPSADAAATFGFDDVARIAQAAADGPYEDESGKIPDFLLKLDYDQWRDIRFRKSRSLWRTAGLPFTVEFFHPGLYYNLPVEINTVEDGRVRPVQFSKQLFSYGKNDFVDQIPDDLGFAGFRLHYRLNRDDYFDEVAVFLGASYFRAVAKGLVYGLSARGLAVDTAADAGEEFPYFKRFWLVKPVASADRITVFALLDSKSLTGAYQFVIHPGRQTRMDVTLRLFIRASGRKIGLAPLTSMFFYAQTENRRPVDDFRPEIHDSDGLLLAYPSGEYVWRPLINPQRLFVNAFKMPQPAGFGLLQRDTQFDHYQDLEAHYEKRPSVWVQPLGQWGPGHVELVQIPVKNEKNDNIVAYWVADSSDVQQASPLYRYRLTWYGFGDRTRQHDGGYVTATRTSAGRDADSRRFILDFKGGALAKLPAELPADAPLEAVIWTDDKAEVVEQQLYKNPDGGWRLVFEIKKKDQNALQTILPDNHAAPPIELRAHLKQGATTMTETWSYAVWR